MSRGKLKKLRNQPIIKKGTAIESRSFLRNNLKKIKKSNKDPRPNKIQKNWRVYRIKKVGVVAFLIEYKATTRKHILLDDIYI